MRNSLTGIENTATDGECFAFSLLLVGTESIIDIIQQILCDRSITLST